ncbi:hypothetical protein KH5_18710 [Urechidicola sp. KH5]
MKMFLKYKMLVSFIFCVVLFVSCRTPQLIDTSFNWENRECTIPTKLKFKKGSTYLSVYSQIYSQDEQITHNLTATISIRNTNSSDTLYIKQADYHNTSGVLIRTYVEKPIFVAPLETIEIIINEKDPAGGTGGNFIFSWVQSKKANKPIFEGVMISTSGQQGLSFVTNGVDL